MELIGIILAFAVFIFIMMGLLKAVLGTLEFMWDNWWVIFFFLFLFVILI